MSLYLDKGDQLICIAEVAHTVPKIRSGLNSTRGGNRVLPGTITDVLPPSSTRAVVDCSSSAIMAAPQVYNVSQSPITSHAFNADRTRVFLPRFRSIRFRSSLCVAQRSPSA